MSSQQARQSGVRVTSQQRSAVRQRSIVDATIQVIAEHGVSDVTHRLVAKYANVSVAATTYYYATKLDLIADASGHLLSGNAQNFQRFAERPDPSISFRDLVTRVIINAAETNRLGSLAWCEIVVAGARDPEARALTIDWFDNLTRLWRRIAAMLGEDRPGDLARSAIDLSLGLLFTALAMGSSDRNARRVLRGQEDARQVWRPAAPVTQIRPSDMQAFTSKARLTHEKILAAAIDILTSNGKSAVTYRAVAKKAGLTTAAPTYYFPTMDDLLAAAQERLFQNTKKRHDRVMSMIDPANSQQRWADRPGHVGVYTRCRGIWTCEYRQLPDLAASGATS